MIRRVFMTVALWGVLAGSASASGGPSKPVDQVPPVKVAPPTQPRSDLRRDMKKILSGRDYRQLRREALRAKEKKKSEPPKKSCQNDKRQSQGCQNCGEGCRGCGAPGAGVGGAGGLVSGLLYLLVILAIAFIVGLIVWAIARHFKKEIDDDLEALLDEEAMQPSTPPGEHPSSEYLQRALAFSKDGNHRAAIRQLLLGCMSWIERNGLIRYRQGLTNRDYLRAVFRRDVQRRGMDGIITQFELIYFGRRDATADRFRQCLSGFEAGFTKDEEEPEMAH